MPLSSTLGNVDLLLSFSSSTRLTIFNDHLLWFLLRTQLARSSEFSAGRLRALCLPTMTNSITLILTYRNFDNL